MKSVPPTAVAGGSRTPASRRETLASRQKVMSVSGFGSAAGVDSVGGGCAPPWRCLLYPWAMPSPCRKANKLA